MISTKLLSVYRRSLLNAHILKQNYSVTPEDFNPFAADNSTPFINLQYKNWQRDPYSVEPCWGYFFRNSARDIYTGQGLYDDDGGGGGPPDIEKHLAVQTLIRSYQCRGHLVAKLDPLNIQKNDETPGGGSPPETMQHLKLTEQDMQTVFNLNPEFTAIGGSETSLPLKQIIKRLEHIYCQHIGLEYMYIYSKEECQFIREKFETPGAVHISSKQRIQCLKKLCQAFGLENFLGRKWSSEKRFGLEGGEVTVPVLQMIIDMASSMGMEKMIIGMPHRGRLNVLANICHVPIRHIFAQYHGLKTEDEGSGDVKYHLGCTTKRLNEFSNKDVEINLLANPSHLETVNAVALGKCRAEQFFRKDPTGKKVMTVLMHGDASFCGQGVVYETFHMTYLPMYTTRGCIHVVVNNQVGFTTDPRFSRSSRYCTDVGKVVNAPIFHVNGDSPEDCVYVAKVATEFRYKFQKDVVIDIVCYRRRGHNEADQPKFTQPMMYKIIDKIEPIFLTYSKQLVQKTLVPDAEIVRMTTEYDKLCDDEYKISKQMKTVNFKIWLDSKWKGFFKDKPLKYPKTGIKEDMLEVILMKYSTPPSNFNAHIGIKKILENRRNIMREKLTDFSMGEALAFCSLLHDGVHVRISGEDVERGTFSQRHHVIHDQEIDGKKYNFIENVYPEKGVFSSCNSALSEYGVMGFEHGYSLVNPNSLVIWEAQFGDFFNGGQTLVDTYLAAGEAKWTRQCGLVLNLPHGMDGMGPEHSSARPERFLIMCTDDENEMPPPDEDFAIKQLKACNWILVNCSTPSSYFHVLRRQVMLPFRKVLVNMSPKFVLRNPEARSPFSEYLVNTQFERVISDKTAAANPGNVKKHVFCSGKVYYDLTKIRRSKKLEGVIAITRIEQISPFPFDRVRDEVAKYPQANVFWCQEEHKNSGMWMYVRPRIKTASSKEPTYIGRGIAAAPATGSKYQHIEELQALLADFVNIQ